MKIGVSSTKPCPKRALQWILSIEIPWDLANASIMSKPTLCLVPWYFRPGLPNPTKSHALAGEEAVHKQRLTLPCSISGLDYASAQPLVNKRELAGVTATPLYVMLQAPHLSKENLFTALN
eukprot:TRINITY_DN3209_c0_g2_i1.p2 TRINITY_DN3209_c0_g2~~TRINITY_DN3209_c0_g2_i1.p2  ORF type:complete len:121 (-),score=7.52 TRINITY_DN3209_c0_g2_i1:87-449(-)